MIYEQVDKSLLAFKRELYGLFPSMPLGPVKSHASANNHRIRHGNGFKSHVVR